MAETLADVHRRKKTGARPAWKGLVSEGMLEPERRKTAGSTVAWEG